MACECDLLFFCATSLNNNRKRDISPPFCCKAPDRQQTCLFLTRTYLFLQPRSVLLAVRPLPLFPVFFSFLHVFGDCPLLPPNLKSHGTVQPGLTSAVRTVPLWRVYFGGGEEGVLEQKRKHCVVRQSASFLLAPSLSILISSRDTTSVRPETHGACQECVSVCAVCLHRREIKDFWKKQTNKHFRMKTDGQLCCCYLLYRAHTHTHSHTQLLFCPSVFFLLPPINIVLLPPPQRAEPRWSQPVSVYVSIWILYFIISLQTASSLIILLTIILRMVSIS